MRHFEYKGFDCFDDGGPDAKWIGRRPDGLKLRADTKQGLKGLITEIIANGDRR